MEELWPRGGCILRIPADPIPALTQAWLKALLDYDPNTGIFTRLVTTANAVGARSGDIANASHCEGYTVVSVFGYPRTFLAHRLAFLYMEGDMPLCVDHIDGDRSNNRWTNLRRVSRTENARNRDGWVKPTASGMKGVYPSKGENRWCAKITVNYKQINLGVYGTPEEAKRAYDIAAKQHFGEFSKP